MGRRLHLDPGVDWLLLPRGHSGCLQPQGCRICPVTASRHASGARGLARGGGEQGSARGLHPSYRPRLPIRLPNLPRRSRGCGAKRVHERRREPLSQRAGGELHEDAEGRRGLPVRRSCRHLGGRMDLGQLGLCAVAAELNARGMRTRRVRVLGCRM